MMNYSTRNKTTTLINLNDVPHNVGEGFLQAPTSRQTITTTTSITPHGVKMSKARQALGDDKASKVSISRKKYGHQQASKCCSSSATSLPQGAASWTEIQMLEVTKTDLQFQIDEQKTSEKYSSSMRAELKGGKVSAINLID